LLAVIGAALALKTEDEPEYVVMLRDTFWETKDKQDNYSKDWGFSGLFTTYTKQSG